jgi:hypothetical protein
VEKVERGKLYYYGLGFVAPGIGHFALGRWFRGIAFALLSLLAFFWGVWEALRPLIMSIASYLSEQKNAVIEEVNFMYFVRISIALLALVFIWGFSFYDLARIMKKDKRFSGDGEKNEDQ